MVLKPHLRVSARSVNPIQGVLEMSLGIRMCSWHVLECFCCTAGGLGCVSVGHPQASKHVPSVLVAFLISIEISVTRP